MILKDLSYDFKRQKRFYFYFLFLLILIFFFNLFFIQLVQSHFYIFRTSQFLTETDFCLFFWYFFDFSEKNLDFHSLLIVESAFPLYIKQFSIFHFLDRFVNSKK